MLGSIRRRTASPVVSSNASPSWTLRTGVEQSCLRMRTNGKSMGENSLAVLATSQQHATGPGNDAGVVCIAGDCWLKPGGKRTDLASFAAGPPLSVFVFNLECAVRSAQAIPGRL